MFTYGMFSLPQAFEPACQTLSILFTSLNRDKVCVSTVQAAGQEDSQIKECYLKKLNQKTNQKTWRDAQQRNTKYVTLSIGDARRKDLSEWKACFCL